MELFSIQSNKCMWQNIHVLETTIFKFYANALCIFCFWTTLFKHYSKKYPNHNSQNSHSKIKFIDWNHDLDISKNSLKNLSFWHVGSFPIWIRPWTGHFVHLLKHSLCSLLQTSNNQSSDYCFPWIFLSCTFPYIWFRHAKIDFIFSVWMHKYHEMTTVFKTYSGSQNAAIRCINCINIQSLWELFIWTNVNNQQDSSDVPVFVYWQALPCSSNYCACYWQTAILNWQ